MTMRWRSYRVLPLAALLSLSIAPAHAGAPDDTPPKPALELRLDDARGDTAEVYRSDLPRTQAAGPEIVTGVRGGAWRSDGYSNWLETPLTLSAKTGFAIEAYVALESLPSDNEVAVKDLRPASFVNQATATRGLDLYVDTFGRWGVRMSTSSGDVRAIAQRPFPHARWTHVAATYDVAARRLTLFLDGAPVADAPVPAGARFLPAAAPLRVARSWQDATFGAFHLNGLNGAFDAVKVYDTPVRPGDLRLAATTAAGADASRALAVPASRFAADLQRPRFHALPPANWTNEPHGLTRRDGQWHLFYQRTPNGPYKTQMTWGHMSSADLVNWRYVPDVLWPTLQTPAHGYDMKGIWSGDVVQDTDGVAYAMYTSVNQDGPYNPGISVATTTTRDLSDWHKRGPVLDRGKLLDFRDPYLWREGDGWAMVVGAAMPGGHGGLAYYRCAALSDPGCWRLQPEMADFAAMDIGSGIWEMPVFEALGGGKHIMLANPILGRVTKYGALATRPIYWIGRWDGSRFTPDTNQARMLDLIPGHLSPTMERDAAGRLVGIGIVDERRSGAAQRAAGWTHIFGLPRVWRLLPDGHSLGQSPWPALTELRAANSAITRRMRASAQPELVGRQGRMAEVQATFAAPPVNRPYGIVVAASPDGRERTEIRYDPARKQIVLDKSRSSLSGQDEGPQVLTGAYDEAAFGKPSTFRVFIDHSAVDVFINDAAAFSFRAYPTLRDSDGVWIFGGGSVDVTLWRMNAATFRSSVGAKSPGKASSRH